MQLNAQKVWQSLSWRPKSSDDHNASRLTRDLDASTSTPQQFHPGFQRGSGPGQTFPKPVLAFIQHAYKKKQLTTAAFHCCIGCKYEFDLIL